MKLVLRSFGVTQSQKMPIKGHKGRISIFIKSTSKLSTYLINRKSKWLKIPLIRPLVNWYGLFVDIKDRDLNIFLTCRVTKFMELLFPWVAINFPLACWTIWMGVPSCEIIWIVWPVEVWIIWAAVVPVWNWAPPWATIRTWAPSVVRSWGWRLIFYKN